MEQWKLYVNSFADSSHTVEPARVGSKSAREDLCEVVIFEITSNRGFVTTTSNTAVRDDRDANERHSAPPRPQATSGLGTFGLEHLRSDLGSSVSKMQVFLCANSTNGFQTRDHDEPASHMMKEILKATSKRVGNLRVDVPHSS